MVWTQQICLLQTNYNLLKTQEIKAKQGTKGNANPREVQCYILITDHNMSNQAL